MNTYLTTIENKQKCKIRVKANSPEEARLIFQDFIEDEDGSEYVFYELDNSSDGYLECGSFELADPDSEGPTIVMDSDGKMSAYYEQSPQAAPESRRSSF